MMKSLFGLLYVCLAGVVLTGCVSIASPRTCDQISASELRALIQQTLSVEQASHRIAEIFHMLPEAITVKPVEEGHILSWAEDGMRYDLMLKSLDEPRVRVTYESNPPSAEQIIQCLGKPEKYWAFYFPSPQVARRPAMLQLFFPDLGITGWGSRYGSEDQPPRLDGGISMDALEFVPQGSPQEVMSQLLETYSLSHQEQIRQQLRPWPEKWEDIVVEIPR